ncbi:MAG: T9SS type A sorting domain-containing protein [Crocinitomicaceae bacterium]|nr:T9SS type A sorting domain-containing protein [Crocinitomicaceae bacterium]
MKQLILYFLAFCSPLILNAQLTYPDATATGLEPVMTLQNKAPGDSCGAYINDYVGLNKTSLLYYEDIRIGTAAAANTYNGRAQRFHAPVPIEVSGITFYAFETNPTVDSVIAITHLYDYEPVGDTVGALLAVDTVWVTHQNYTIVLPNVRVNSVFDTPVTVTDDYMVAIFTPDDDSLKLMVSDFAGGDGNGEAVSYLFYGNPNYSSFIGWYNGYNTFGPTYDGDYLISPVVNYDLNDGFLLSDDTICPDVVSAACVSYSQSAIYSNHHYNAYSSTPTNHILWLWGDGFQNTNLTTACHTYTTSGDFDITLNDTLARHNFASPVCVGQVTTPIHVKFEPVADFTFVQTASTVDFTNTSSYADSIWWDFGDTTAGTSMDNPTHQYDSIATYDVWLYVYNECGIDSIMYQVTTDDVGVENNEFDFKMYPNPANTSVSISGLNGPATVELINILGQPVMREQSTGSVVTIPTSAFSNGSYFVRVTTANGQITKKLVIRH